LFFFSKLFLLFKKVFNILFILKIKFSNINNKYISLNIFVYIELIKNVYLNKILINIKLFITSIIFFIKFKD